MTATKTTIALGVVAVATTVTALYEVQNARAAGVALDASRSNVAGLRRQTAEWSTRAQAEETALAEVRTAARVAAEKVAAAQAAAREKQKNAEALRQFLDSDPQLQRLNKERNLQAGIRWHLPLGLGFKLSPEELEQFALEFERRREESKLGDPYQAKSPMDYSNLSGIPARLANDPRFIEAWKVWDTRLTVENFNLRLWEPLNATQAGQLFQTIQSARPSPIPADGWDWEGILRTVDWERVLADASSYLSPSQMTALRGHVAAGRRRMLLITAAKQAIP